MSASMIRTEDLTSELPGRLAMSAAAQSEGAWMRTADIDDWLAAYSATHRFRIDRIPFSALDDWSFGTTGNLEHRSGKFFTVEGLEADIAGPAVAESAHWRQPIIVQPEIGILGVLAGEFDGVMHFLMQAKMEPGNPNLIQLSPTVQATRSNYTRVHRGAAVPYLDHFWSAVLTPTPVTSIERGRVLADVIQSEFGSWAFRKANRNMIIETSGDLPVFEGFCWLTLGQIGALLRRDNLVNMDARSVFSCLPMTAAGDNTAQTDARLVSWLRAERSRTRVRVGRVPLDAVPDWARDGWSVGHNQGRYFDVVALSVQADTREVGRWTQPLFRPAGRGLSAFVARRFGGVPHLLARATAEAGARDAVEFGPTVLSMPGDPGRPGERFASLVRAARSDRIRYAAVLSEEGGRFLDAESDYLIVEADETEVPASPPEGYQWVTPGQLSRLSRRGHHLNAQARSLLAAINAQAAHWP